MAELMGIQKYFLFHDLGEDRKILSSIYHHHSHFLSVSSPFFLSLLSFSLSCALTHTHTQETYLKLIFVRCKETYCGMKSSRHSCSWWI